MLNTVDLFFHHELLTSAEIGNGAVFTCAGFGFVLIWGKTTIYVFKPHSCDIEGNYVPNGQADFF